MFITGSVGLLRGITAVPFHVLATVSLIVCFSVLKYSPWKMLIAVVVVALAHTLYNLAAAELVSFLSLIPILLIIWALALVLVLGRLDARYTAGFSWRND